ncbi:unnamed protein product [Durusdinium trenchii]|uniref:Uncharacterized protein n=1 Tax=Durusdinium trenchii TaxID=1381693 RepID=A0ABP0IGV0_9DINO
MSPDEGPEHKRRRLDAAIDDSLEDYTPSEPAEPTDEVDTPGNPSFPAAAPAASTAPEPPEQPAVPEHLLPAVPEHLDEMSDQPEPSIEPEPPSVPATPMNLDPADLPVPLEKLDDIRVTIFREPGQEPSATTDHFKTENVFKRHSKEAAKGLPPKWVGCTIFQINAVTRMELGMTATLSSSSLTSVKPIRKAAQHMKNQQLRHIKKEKSKSEIREKNLTQAEQQLRLTQEGWTPHDLDPCLFILHHYHEDGSSVPCGLIALHVDDMLGAGDRGCATYIAAERRLKEVFEFRSWQEDHESMEYCGVIHNRKDFTWNLSQSHFLHKEESSFEDEYVSQDEAADTGPTSWPSSKSLRTPMAMMIYFTQIKAVTAESTGDFTQLKPDGLCLAGDEPAKEWSILTYLFLFILFTTLVVSYLTYKLGRFHEHRRQVNDLKVKLRVAQTRNERHFDGALDDQYLFFDRRISQLENDLVKAAEANAETRRHHNEMMEQWRLEQQEAEEIDQSFRQCQAFLSRCYRELLDHFDEDYPLTTGTHVTPFGHTFHVRADCHGLKQAHRVDRRSCCAFCNPTPQTPHRVNGLSDTTLQEDMMS